jgi:hypothetical protein
MTPAVAIKVAGLDDRPGGGAEPRPADWVTRAPFISQIASSPVGGVVPENVALAVAIKVAGLDDRPGGGAEPRPADWVTCAPFISTTESLQ